MYPHVRGNCKRRRKNERLTLSRPANRFLGFRFSLSFFSLRDENYKGFFRWDISEVFPNFIWNITSCFSFTELKWKFLATSSTGPLSKRRVFCYPRFWGTSLDSPADIWSWVDFKIFYIPEARYLANRTAIRASEFRGCVYRLIQFSTTLKWSPRWKLVLPGEATREVKITQLKPRV